MSNSSSNSAPVEVAAPPPAAQISSEAFSQRATADGDRIYERRSSWELADKYHKTLWLRQAGGADVKRAFAQ